MIVLSRIRELDLSAASSAGRHLHLSAASGLVRTDQHLYMIADDELHLGVFGTQDTDPGRLIRLFPGELPAASDKRKKHKPDLETLMQLPPFRGYPHGALLALGSGGRHRRRRGILLALDANGVASERSLIFDLEAIYAELTENFTALNIEGGVVCGNEFVLLQRGNKRDSGSAVIRYPLSEWLEALGSSSLGSSDERVALTPEAIHRIDLGNIAGIPLCFTDGAALGNGDIVFSAVAENTDDNYHDGPCAGAAIGTLSRDGRLLSLHRLHQPHKIEGIDARLDGDVIRLLLVTDADDADIPATLYSATLKVA